MAKIFDIGDRVQLRCEFRNESDVLTDPTTTTLQIKDPAGAESAPTPTSSVAGIWTYNLDVTLAGVYYYRFKGVGAVVAAAESKFEVRRSAFTNP